MVVGAGFLTALFLFYRYPDSIMAYVACILWPLSILELAQKVATSHSFRRRLNSGKEHRGWERSPPYRHGFWFEIERAKKTSRAGEENVSRMLGI